MGRKPESNLQGYEQKSHTRPSWTGECATQHEAVLPSHEGRCGACAGKVHVLIRGELPDVSDIGGYPRVRADSESDPVLGRSQQKA